MQEKLSYLAISIVLIYAIFNANLQNNKINNSHKILQKNSPLDINSNSNKEKFQKELLEIKKDFYVENYIINVIINGSNQFNFKGGIMEGGFASLNDAPKIACYVLKLSGKKCSNSYDNSQLFYTSICGGCHGDNGKGLNGTYPDLTEKELLGVNYHRL